MNEIATGSLDLLTTDEAAKILKCSTKTITNLAKRGQINVVRVGKLVRITREELVRFATSGGTVKN